MMDIGNKIKSIRREVGMSQKELADGICTQSNISRIEKGLYIPNSYLLKDISKRLNVDLDVLTNDKNISFDSIKYKAELYIESLDYKGLKELLESCDVMCDSNNELKHIYWYKALTEYYVNNDINSAKNLLEQALNIKSDENDLKIEIRLMNSKVILLRNQLTDKEIMNIYTSILSIITKNNLSDTIIIKILLSISNYYFHKNDYANVKETSELALEIIKNEKSNYLLEYHLYNVACSNFKLKIEKEKWSKDLEMARVLAEFNNNNELLIRIEEAYNEFVLYIKDREVC